MITKKVPFSSWFTLINCSSQSCILLIKHGKIIAKAAYSSDSDYLAKHVQMRELATSANIKPVLVPKAFIKGVCRLMNNKANRVSYGYEMDCLISEEFTPAPDYSLCVDIARTTCLKYGVNWKSFKAELKSLAERAYKMTRGEWSIYAECLQYIYESPSQQYASHLQSIELGS